MKEDILENTNKFCIGGKPGHRPQEHLISLKSIIGVFMSRGLGVILQLVDIEKFFLTQNISEE